MSKTLALARQRAVPTDINDIVVNESILPRPKPDHFTVADYTNAIRAGSTFPPILVCRTSMCLIDGLHRLLAHKQAGRKRIAVHFEDVLDDADHFYQAVCANSENSLRFTAGQIKSIQLKAEQMGIEEKRIAVALRLPVERLKNRPTKSFIGDFLGSEVITKPADAHMAGKRFNEEQFEVHKKLGGSRQIDYFHQSKAILEVELTDWQDSVVVRQLVGLCNTLIRKLSENGYGSKLIKPFEAKANSSGVTGSTPAQLLEQIRRTL